jgi:hypothetical protein
MSGSLLKNPLSHYSRQGLWSLFLMVAFPLHLWTLIFGFRDISWLWARTNLWDALGVVSYGLVFTFIESALVFLVTGAAGYLISSRWSEPKRIILLGLWIIVLAAWSALFQYYNLQEREVLPWLEAILLGSGHPLRTLYMIAFLVVLPTVVIPAVLVLFSQRSFSVIQDIFDRLSLLTTVYLFFDAIALVIVVIRNLWN